MKQLFKTFDTFDRLEKLYEADDNTDDTEATDDTATDDAGGDDAEMTDDMGGDEDTGGDMPDGATDMEGGEPMADDGTGGADQGVDPSVDPNAQADVDAGTFVSDIKKAEFAETLLKALKSPVPPAGEIPAQFQNVTTQNADDVINFVTSFVTLDIALADTDDSETVDALKNI